MSGNNLFRIDDLFFYKEHFHSLFSDEKILIERIVSFGQKTNEDIWLDQEKDEWVVLLQGEAELLFETNINKICMKKGDHILIPSHTKHKVVYTSTDPPCIWLAVHFNKTEDRK